MKLEKWSLLFPMFSVVLSVGIVFIGCGDDDGTEPEQITLADLAGYWEAQSYEVTSNAAPEISIELIALGGSFTIDADDTGDFTGTAGIPEAVGGPMTLPFQGTFELVTQDSMRVTFDPEIPPFLTDFTGWFELSGNTMHMLDENTSFDFDQDGVEEPATFDGVMIRS